MSTKVSTSIIVALSLITIALFGSRFFNENTPSSLYAQQVAEAQVSEEALADAEKLSSAFRTAAKVIRPCVVQINALVERRAQVSRPPLGSDLLEELFGGQIERRREPDRGVRKIPAGVGSGVIVSPDGYVLTNNHVVEEADELQVELSDGRSFKAEVVGRDPRTDLAVLKIAVNGLSAARLGDSSLMEVGDWVIAIGSPFGLEQSVTAGIISATNRQTGIISGGQGYEDFLQTDAAINPGNSGGPLINLRGEVIGINTAINSRTGTNIGIGFAIPSNLAQQVLSDLRSGGRVVRGFIGASVANVDSEAVSKLRLPQGVLRGAIIARVLPDGPADKAKLKDNDVVIAANGRPIQSREQLINFVAMSRPGSTLDLQIVRNGERQNVKLVVEEQTPERMSAFVDKDLATVEEWGILLATMNARFAQELGVNENSQGAVIAKMDPRGQAARVNLQLGDILVAVNGRKVTTAQEAKEALEKVGRNISINVQRGNLLLSITASASN
jgi:serine protease Do